MFSRSLATMPTDIVNNSILVLNLDENVYNWIKQGINGYSKSYVDFLVAKIKSFNHVVTYCKEAPVNKFLEEKVIKYKFLPNYSRDTQKTNFIKDLKSKLDIEKRIIFNHGLIETRKNQTNLIKSFLSSNLPQDYNLVILGSPRSRFDEQYLKECIKIKNNLDKNNVVRFVSGTTNPRLIDNLLNISDVYIMASLAEGLPVALLEAMSAGLPWVSTPAGAVPKILGKFDSGIVLDNFQLNPTEMELAVRSVDGKNSRKDWEDNFTLDTCCPKYLELV